MNEANSKQFTHLKIHTQYSICEGALRTDDLAKAEVFNAPSQIEYWV